MDTTALVEKKREAGRRLLERLDQLHVDIRSAFWLYNREDDLWQLCLSSDLVNKEGPLKLYGTIQQILAELGEESGLALHDITLVTPKAGLVEGLHRVVPTDAGIHSITLRGSVINGVPFDDSLIYRSS